MTDREPSLELAAPPWSRLAAPPLAVESSVTSLRPAGFWRRACALAVDAVVWLLLLRLGDLGTLALARWELAARAFDYTWGPSVPAAYVVLMHGTTGRTLGKVLVGARVVTAAGEGVGYPKALLRLVAWPVSALPLLGGFIMAGVRPDRRALHDLIAGTRVVRVR